MSIDTDYVLYVNKERTVLVRIWTKTGTVEVSTRESADHTWGPPVFLEREV